MMLRLDPPIPLDTPKGRAWAHVLLDYGSEHDLIWCCFIAATGECWCYRNSEVRLAPNITLGIRCSTAGGR